MSGDKNLWRRTNVHIFQGKTATLTLYASYEFLSLELMIFIRSWMSYLVITSIEIKWLGCEHPTIYLWPWDIVTPWKNLVASMFTLNSLLPISPLVCIFININIFSFVFLQLHSMRGISGLALVSFLWTLHISGPNKSP